jgi:hypothetical protein
MASKICPNCGIMNLEYATTCERCHAALASLSDNQAASQEITHQQAAQDSNLNSCAITVSRTSKILGAPRNFEIFVDNEKAGIIGNGESIQVQVPPGEHIVRWEMPQLGNKWLTSATDDLIPTIPGIVSESLSIQLKPGESINLLCESQSGWWKIRGYLEIE